ncbi:DOPA 4,5-dioxygenase family protein [Shewanella surugensis]|uniref:DOPA 4,5-dioxygenase family protein n=1 Tax=Shewanella surugensis TaxID=212020 RepID=A0ABT0LE66_9GAMM|nr:DOPA 4,5-dioxygenase family protein [Shewanella surugensis]MCL1125622.1 DOPA 4,5-dioxygenase family protein [Shewanella surugensis]
MLKSKNIENKNATLPDNIHEFYHAHVYFDEASLEWATKLCQQAARSFELKLGRVHQKLVGPHPCWSCQLAFAQDQYEHVIPWLDENRQGLSILIHADTGHDLKDHTDYASWLGEPLLLNLSLFDKG